MALPSPCHRQALRTLRGRMTCICLLSLTLPLIVAIAAYTIFIHRTLQDKIGDELQSGLASQTALMDDALRTIQEDCNKLILDEALYELFHQDLRTLSDIEYYQADKAVTQALTRCFTTSDVYASYLVAPPHLFGHMQVYHPLDIFTHSRIYETAEASQGQGIWISTFRYGEMFPKAESYSKGLNYSPFFVYTRKIRFISQNGPGTVPQGEELPIVLLYFQTSFFDRFYRASQDTLSDVWIVDGDNVVYASSGAESPPFSLEDLRAMEGGHGRSLTSGGANLLVHVRSENTGWQVITVRSMNELMGDTYQMTKLMLGGLAVVAAGVTCVILVLLERMLRPLNMVTDAIRQSGEGHFKLSLPVSGTRELQTLVEAYNDMNVQIDTLVDDVYRARLSETKTKLLSMQMQMEPHFLYNTLNAINWLAVGNDQGEISEMLTLLANMLRYTLSQENELVPLDKDMQWIRAYTRILRLRFGNSVDFDMEGIDPALFHTQVPVLLFQPFIENSMVHGINGYVDQGLVILRGRFEEGKRIFEVEDNGKGMSGEDLQRLWEKDPLHLGIRNVDMRLKLIYGEEWGVTIQSHPGRTVVSIAMPG